MKNKSKSRIKSLAIIYLVLLLGFVVLYLGTAYPKLAEKINTVNAEISKIKMDINMLNPYVPQIISLNEQAAKAEKEFADNNEIDEPVMFSNIVYRCADDAKVNVTSLAIAENSVVELVGTFESSNYTATLAIGADNNTQIESFVTLLEQNEGSAMFVQGLSYSANGEGIVANITLLMYAVKK